MTVDQARRYIAAVVFIGEGVAILFAPRWTLTNLCRQFPPLKSVLNGCLVWHWDGG